MNPIRLIFEPKLGWAETVGLAQIALLNSPSPWAIRQYWGILAGRWPVSEPWESVGARIAKYRCTLCGKIVERQCLRPRKWLVSYCDEKGKLGRIYRMKP